MLDWDLKSERAYADGPTVAMSELAVNIFSKTESLPYKFRPKELPKIGPQLVAERGDGWRLKVKCRGRSRIGADVPPGPPRGRLEGDDL